MPVTGTGTVIEATSHAQLKAIVQSSKDAYFLFDTELRLIALYDFTDHQVLGKYSPKAGMRIEEVFGWKNASLHEEMASRAIAVERLQYEWTQLVDSTQVFFQVTLSQACDEAGCVIGVAGSVRDITPLKQLENYLIRAEFLDTHSKAQLEHPRTENDARYQLLMDNSPTALCIHVNGRFIYANRSAEQLLGVEYPNQLLGMDSLSIVHPDSRPLVLERIEQMRNDRNPVPVVEEKYIKLDGTILDVEVNALPTFLYDQMLVQVFIHDITEQKRTERALMRRNLELQALNAITKQISRANKLEENLQPALLEIIGVFEMEGGWVQLLPKYRQDPIFEWRVPEGKQGLLKSLNEYTQNLTEQVMQKGEKLMVKGSFSTRKGRKSSAPSKELARAGEPEPAFRFLVVPITVREDVIGTLGVFRKYSDEFNEQIAYLLEAIGREIGIAVENAFVARQETEVKLLQELNRLRSELIGNVSHELRTPLGLIKVFTTTLLQDDVIFSREMQREFLLNIDDETDRLEMIVNNLLDLSRLDGQRLRLELCLTDIPELIEGVARSMEVQLSNDLSVTIVCDPNLNPILADPGRIEQVLRNLLGNAIKYSPEGGNITVDAKVVEQQVIISVKDEGIGIPPGDLERIFERFYRSENATNQRARGVGLGLAVSRGIVEAHDGRIWAESSSGAGSTFYFTIPVQLVLK